MAVAVVRIAPASEPECGSDKPKAPHCASPEHSFGHKLRFLFIAAERADQLSHHIGDGHRHGNRGIGGSDLSQRQGVGDGTGLHAAQRLGHVDAQQAKLG